MKAFDFDHNLIDAYARFSRSFSTIRADDLKAEIKSQYDTDVAGQMLCFH